MGLHNSSFVSVMLFGMVLIIIKKSAVADNLGELNDRCTHVNDCRKFAYFCSGNRTCQCLPSYFVHEVKKICVAGVDQKCKYDEHCIDGAFCEKQEKCQCKETSPYILEGGKICSHSSDVKGTFLFIALSLIGFYIL